MSRITLVPREQLLYEIGDVRQWRRRFRMVVHYSTRHYIACLKRIGVENCSHAKLKQLMRAIAKEWFGVSTWAKFRAQQEHVRNEIMLLPSINFAGQSDIVKLCNNET